MDIRDLRTFYWVAHLGGFRRAAEYLNTTQPAISARIQHIEEILGAKVLHRTGRGPVTPTQKGRQLFGYAERMLALHCEMLQTLSVQPTLLGKMHIGVSETIVHTWLPELLRQLCTHHPSLDIEIAVDLSPALSDHVLTGELDLALSLGPTAVTRLHTLPLCEYPLSCICSRALPLDCEPLPLAKLVQWPILTYASSTLPCRQVAQVLNAERSGTTTRIFGSDSLPCIVRMMLDGIGIGIVPRDVVRRELEAGSLKELQVCEALPTLQFKASYLPSLENASVQAVARLAQAVATTYSMDHAPAHGS